MNIKLFSVMGISWLLEIMATLYKQQSFWWSISDVFNCLQGVLVFFVFVFKRKVLVAFQKKLGKNLDHSPPSFMIILFTTHQFILCMHDLRGPLRPNFSFDVFTSCILWIIFDSKYKEDENKNSRESLPKFLL